jgi:hypothetical protein
MKKNYLILLVFLFAGYTIKGQEPGNTQIPRLISGIYGSMMIDNKPFLMLSAEVHNSSSSNLAYMESVWDKLVKMNCNTALVPVCWEQLEPKEGEFDFSLVDGIIKGAREHHLKVVFLWFGSWKNTWSTYVPGWVKKDTRRFPRAQKDPGINWGLLSPFGDESVKADARAFSVLMRKIKELDERERTVIMVQVENEVGIHAVRDYNWLANEQYDAPVPEELISYLNQHKNQLTPELNRIWSLSGYRQNGTWPEVFPESAPEIFMAWSYAKYINKVVEAGKKEYPLPMYVNAWIVQNNSLKLGGYPQGGPVAKMMNIWRAGAPLIDLYAPDIYINSYKNVCATYNTLGNPLFIPENNNDQRSAANAIYAFSKHAAIGYGPFGIDQVGDDMPLNQAYKMLDELMPWLIRYRGTGNLTGFLLGDGEEEESEFKGYKIKAAALRNKNTDDVPANAMVIALSEDEFLITGTNISIDFYSGSADTTIVDMLSLQEGEFVNGNWEAGRRLNGDERQVRFGNDYKILRLKLYRYPLHQEE